MAQVSRINMGGIDYDIRDKVLEKEVANIKPIVNQGTINNAADEEDLTSENNLLKLKDRSAINGMGYVILRKNKTFAEQVKNANTIYEIRYDFDLNGKTISLPRECVLKFDGGSLVNGKLIGDQTSIEGTLYNIFNNVILEGRYANYTSNLVWWGAKSGVGVDNSTAIDCALKSNIYVVEVSDRYYISSPIELPYNKVIKGRTGNNNQLIGFYANENFASKSVDFPARNGKDAFSQEVKGMFYHRDTTKCEMHDVFVDARHYADFCIEHIDLYGSIDMYNCYIGGANKVGLLQYACENPVYDQLYIVDCHIGMIISTNKFTDGNPLEKAFYEGTSMGMPNIVSGKNIRTMSCNYGFIINGGSDFKIDSLETAHNSIIGAIVRNCYGELNKYYSEGDGRCNFYINGLEKEEAADGYALQSIIDNNLDGVATKAVPVKGKSVYVRGACLFWDSTITLTSAFLSVKPRSYVSVDAESYEWMDNREPQGVDCGIINYNSILVADTIRIYLAPNNIFRNALYSVVISLGKICIDQVSIRFCDNRAIKNIIAPINTLDFAGGDTKMIINQHSVQMSNKLDLNWNIENSRRDFSYQSKDERSCKYYGMYNNRPLYFNGIPMTKPIWFTKEQLDNLADSKFCKVVMLVKVLKTTSIRPKISVMWSDKQYNIVYELGNNDSSAKELEPGEYWLTAFFPTKVSFEYANCAITASVGENEDYVVSHLYIYMAEDGESAPHNFTSVLFNRGYTAQRPTISFEGQEYYDINLHKMIYANSSLNGWVDATGASV